MNEVSPPGFDGSDVSGPATATSEPGFGRTLALARERQGISVADMAARLRLHPRQVTALEEERLDALPEAPFVRGFVRNYAKELQLDPASLLAKLNSKMPATSAAAEALTDTGISAAEVRRTGMERASRIAVIGGLVALLLVLGLIGWMASKRTQPPASAKPAEPVVAPPNESPPAPASQAPEPQPAATAMGAAAPALTAGDPAPPLVIAAAPVVTAAATTPVAAGNMGLRVMVGDRPSWVEITQADGRVVLSGLLEPGTERRLGNPQPPLQVVIGNASSVTLEYRGKAIDLQRHVRANDLARLSLE